MRFAVVAAGVFSLAMASAASADVTSFSYSPISTGSASYTNIQASNTPIFIGTSTGSDGSSSIVFTPDIAGGVWTGAGTGFGTGSVVTFDVAFSTPVTGVGLFFAWSAVGPSEFSAIASVGETVTLHFTPTAQYPSGSLVLADAGLQVAEDAAGVGNAWAYYQLPFAVTSMSIVKSIDVAANGGVASIFSATNTYYTSVPEPASLSLMGLGAVALLRRRRV